MLRLLIKLPTRGRREKVFAVIERYRALLSARVPVRFVVTCDLDDAEMNTQDVRSRMSTIPSLTLYYGTHHTKVEAVNADIPWQAPGDPPSWDILLVASDDMIPVEPGYDWVIVREMEERYPDLDGVLFHSDGYVHRRLNTFPILGRTYYSRTQWIYHPSYKSLFCDNEFHNTAERLGKQTYFDKVLIRHEHPGNVSGIDHDETYLRNNKDHRKDKANYELRASRGFDL